MIAPNMGTMLAFIYTDAELPADLLKAALVQATRRSFNRIVVDGDTSTNDIALCTATGKAGKVNMNEFQDALKHAAGTLQSRLQWTEKVRQNSSK